jgi:A/G-specific adenine glycosylase
MKLEDALFDQQLVTTIQRRLLRWGRSVYKDFPWRDERDPWLSLVAEIMLQRTRASQVEPVYREFRLRYPTAERLVAAGPSAAREITDRLGLHWRGDLLFQAAVSVSESGGVPPDDLNELRRIRGVGPYTAAAWLSLHRNKRSVIVDANISRWLSRMSGRPYEKDPRHVRWVNELADSLTPTRAFRRYNYALLDFTMSICTPRAPHCEICPVRRYCEYGKASHRDVREKHQ